MSLLKINNLLLNTDKLTQTPELKWEPENCGIGRRLSNTRFEYK